MSRHVKQLSVASSCRSCDTSSTVTSTTVPRDASQRTLPPDASTGCGPEEHDPIPSTMEVTGPDGVSVGVGVENSYNKNELNDGTELDLDDFSVAELDDDDDDDDDRTRVTMSIPTTPTERQNTATPTAADLMNADPSPASDETRQQRKRSLPPPPRLDPKATESSLDTTTMSLHIDMTTMPTMRTIDTIDMPTFGSTPPCGASETEPLHDAVTPQSLRIPPLSPRVTHPPPAPIAINPFVNRTRYSKFFLLKTIIVGSILFIPRLVIFLTALTIGGLTCHITCWWIGKKRLQESCQQSAWIRGLVSVLARTVLFSLGYLWIRTHGKAAKSSTAPILVANHCNVSDIFFFLYNASGAFVAKAEVAKIPLVSAVYTAIQSITVDRSDKDSTNKVLSEIKRRSQSGQWHRTIIFAEGTTTNQSALISFKYGPFLPGVTVQPVLLRYKFWFLDPSDVGKMNPGLFVLLAMCQVVNFLEVHYLPPYTPSPFEQSNPALFAHNVRHAMSVYLGPKRSIPTTAHTFDDARIQIEAKRLRLPYRSFALELKKEFPTMSPAAARTCVKRFAMMDKDKDGVITFGEFEQSIRVAENLSTRSLADHPGFLKCVFDLLDADGDNRVSFRDYFFDMSVLDLRPDLSAEEIQAHLEISYKMLDVNGDDAISRDEVAYAIQLMLHRKQLNNLSINSSEAGAVATDEHVGDHSIMNESAEVTQVADAVFRAMDRKEQGSVGLSDFVVYATENPELVAALVRSVQLANEENAF
eukprot:PhM_4_TR2106/c0_g1_i2/m.6350/K13510/LPCAT1_2; lysophosphatidylcholine acyltransferase / lyso-PAF acetyltransferase